MFKMKSLKNNKPLRWLLGVILLILLVCYLPQEILFLTLCTKQDREIPPNTEVIVSACKRPVVRGVPGGETLFVHEVRTGRMYLLDLRTGEKRKVLNDPLLLDKGIFLSSELVWLEGSPGGPGSPSYHPHYVLNLTDGKRYELLDLTWLPLKEGRFDPKHYEYLKSADQVFLHHSKNRIIALSSDLSQGNNVILYKSSPETDEKGKLLEQLMRDLGLDYEIVDLSTTQYTDIPSPTNRYVVRNNGIYLSGTDVSIVNREYTGGRFMGGYFKSWYYDESGVVVQGGGDYLLSLPFGNVFYYIPSPILKLNLP